ncbi:hypothetical protein PV325_002318 [Microctonus aethiopoides]|uniref:Serine/arginine repetitive matrix protein 1 n=1 Tax=Microctonus aethiopoides TaxID=144406 RepID=A0AA39F8D7_9HYME|nr:hypothetical protein PV325_002318 [Microctonus aethiopoides]KAK0093927.1 hypothetical protein PV326_012315 [Microctonus aethiopoides]KAK0164837.1 hypothetical protein PV328_003409 [Microctonus aethiopoides]
MSRDYDNRRRGGTSASGSSKMRMDTSVSQSRAHGESSSSSSTGKRKELDNVMRKARESQSSYWNKKLLEVEERDPNRWRHSGYKELYVGGANSGETSRSHPRSPRSPRPRSPHSPRVRSPPRERNHTRSTRPARSPSSGSTCSDKSCSVCSPREHRRRVAAQSRSRSRSMSPVRHRAQHPKEIVASSSRAIIPRARPRSPPPMPRPRTPPPAPQPPSSRHQKEYKALKEKEAMKARRKEKHHSTRVPEDPRVPDPIPLMRKAVKIEKTHSSGHPPPTAIIHQPAAESSGSEDSDSSSNASHVGPPRMTLSERFGKMAQWSVDRRDMENMRITKDGENAMKVVIEGEERVARLGYDSPPPGHYPETLMAQGPRGLDCWDDVRVRYDYYKARGYLRDLTLDDYVKWEEWWYKYQDWLEAERFYEQWAASGGRPVGGGGRKRRGRRNNPPH